MSWTQADLDKLNAAIASGAQRVKYQDQEVEYRTINEMFKAKAAIEAELGTSGCRRETFITCKGL